MHFSVASLMASATLLFIVASLFTERLFVRITWWKSITAGWEKPQWVQECLALNSAHSRRLRSR